MYAQARGPTTSFIVCIASIMGCIQYALMQEIPWNLAFVHGSTSIATGFLAEYGRSLLREYDSGTFWSVISIAGVTIVACILVFAVGYKKYIAAWKNGS